MIPVGLLIFLAAEWGRGGVKAACKYSFTPPRESLVKPPARRETNATPVATTRNVLTFVNTTAIA